MTLLDSHGDVPALLLCFPHMLDLRGERPAGGDCPHPRLCLYVDAVGRQRGGARRALDEFSEYADAA